MQIQIDERNQIIGYAIVGGFPNGIEVDAPEEFGENFAPGKYLYDKGTIVENPDYIEPVNNEAIQEEIESLKDELSASDYKVLKYVEGWISEEKYETIRAERQSIREQIRELERSL